MGSIPITRSNFVFWLLFGMTAGSLGLSGGCATTKMTEAPRSGASLIFTWPLVQPRVVVPFGSPEEGVPLQGVRLRSVRSGEVRAWEDGRVILVEPRFGEYGSTVIVEHDRHLVSVYAGLSKVNVSPGTSVRRQEPIALAERTADGWECYFEIRRQARAVDPVPMIGQSAGGQAEPR